MALSAPTPTKTTPTNWFSQITANRKICKGLGEELDRLITKSASTTEIDSLKGKITKLKGSIDRRIAAAVLVPLLALAAIAFVAVGVVFAWPAVSISAALAATFLSSAIAVPALIKAANRYLQSYKQDTAAALTTGAQTKEEVVTAPAPAPAKPEEQLKTKEEIVAAPTPAPAKPEEQLKAKEEVVTAPAPAPTNLANRVKLRVQTQAANEAERTEAVTARKKPLTGATDKSNTMITTPLTDPAISSDNSWKQARI